MSSRFKAVFPCCHIHSSLPSQGQAVVANAQRAERFPAATGPDLKTPDSPVLHRLPAMIPFQHERRQPSGCRPAQASSLSVAMRLDVFIQ